MTKHTKARPRGYCSFVAATLKHTCPHYKPGHHGYECRGFEQGITHLGSRTVYHCRHDPPRQQPIHLPL